MVGCVESYRIDERGDREMKERRVSTGGKRGARYGDVQSVRRTCRSRSRREPRRIEPNVSRGGGAGGKEQPEADPVESSSQV